ncbi:hypothetical protein V6N12_052842 [Hibiscus sabdariffa]|uniref:Uncharacterized protein n=1 Tax=Hibiscus sabdariffa TaxID=183260 RepID=A0ABR2C4M5_9ROSI
MSWPRMLGRTALVSPERQRRATLGNQPKGRKNQPRKPLLLSLKESRYFRFWFLTQSLHACSSFLKRIGL